jgi:hypothetical protein
MRILHIAPLALMTFLPALQAQQPLPPGTFWSKDKIAADLEKRVGH